ncbi:MAG: HAD family hydrolase [Planctomycetaceae bacterium]
MSESDIHAVIFDCDGTLVDSEKLSLAVLVDYVGELGLPLELDEALRRFAGGELPKVFAELETRLGRPLPADHMDQFRSRQLARLATDLEVIDGAAELLGAMTKPFCVASNAPLMKVNLCLKTTGLDRFFADHHRLSAYQIEKWKPEPDLFLKSASVLQTKPENCAVVEDTDYGIDAGLRAGMRVFGYDPDGELNRRPDVEYVCDLRELNIVFA